MTYGQIADVKERLKRAPTDTTWDDSIERALNQADALIDLELQNYTPVPITTDLSNVIIDAANDWAAGLVQQEIINPTNQGKGEENVFIKRAKDDLARYIAITFRQTETGMIYEQPVNTGVDW